MTRPAVIDASALAAVAFFEAEAGDVRARIAGRSLVAPTLLPYEMASIAAKKLRQDPSAELMIRTGLASSAKSLSIALGDVQVTGVFDLALAMRLTPYDASYLWLAKRLGTELITLDAALTAAARQVL